MLGQARQGFEQRLFDVDDEDWKALVDARAATEVEHAVLSVLSRGFVAPVVGVREDLGPPGSFLTLRDLERRLRASERGGRPRGARRARGAHRDGPLGEPARGICSPTRPALVRRAVLRIAKRALRPNLTANIAETERPPALAAAAVKDAVIQIKKGQKIIGDGELVTQDHLRMLAAMRAQTDRFDVFEASGAAPALVALLLAGIWTFHRAGLPPLPPHPARTGSSSGAAAARLPRGVPSGGRGRRRAARPLAGRCRSQALLVLPPDRGGGDAGPASSSTRSWRSSSRSSSRCLRGRDARQLAVRSRVYGRW